MTSLAQRSEAEEQMDAADLPPDTYAMVLGDLAQVNALTMAARPTLAFLERIVRPGQSLRLLDVGFGHGDMLRRVARWGEKRGIACELVGIDLNPRSEAVAREATAPGMPITYRTGDYAALAGEGWDAVISSLVAHHMSREQLLAFLQFMDREARLGWLVNDLHRHRLAHMGFPLLARAMAWHRIVREDGTLSVARSFRPGEWHEILDGAGVQGAEVRRWFPFRLCVSRVR
jgi:2-polyprenyl-3-methyl-5-hydroxy-6-metoxy-1,4-benzoquinol methylase